MKYRVLSHVGVGVDATQMAVGAGGALAHSWSMKTVVRGRGKLPGAPVGWNAHQQLLRWHTVRQVVLHHSGLHNE